MKNLIILILLLSSLVIKSQTIGLTYCPDKSGIGILLSKPVLNELSAVVSFEYGKYKYLDESSNLYKAGIGLRYNWFYIIYHYNIIEQHRGLFINTNKVKKHSIELGSYCKLTNHLGCGVFTDIINNEVRLALSYTIFK